MNSEIELMPSYGIASLFPVNVYGFDCLNFVDNSYVKVLTDLIDEEIEQGYFCDNDPKYQTQRNLFLDERASLIKDLFVRSVYTYIENSKDTFSEFLDIKITDSRGWGFRSNKDSNTSIKGPWHNHVPSPITGVFYLKLPKDDYNCGTEFNNPIGFLKNVTDIASIKPVPLSWAIFPGWLQHRSVLSSSSEYRYVIAADCFLSYSLKPQ